MATGKTRHAHRCPLCGSTRTAPILYGFPTTEATALENEEKLWIGGCVIELDQPTMHCFGCDEDWRPGSVKSTRTRRRRNAGHGP